jgi:nucleoside-diphosphate-sugar epimerase
MDVFVAGATGVLGRRAVERLVATGVRVTGVARRPESRDELRRVGATPTDVSLFDRDGLAAAVAGHEAVCNLATAIPVGGSAGSRSGWEANHRIRREGSRNLVDAAVAAGATTYVQESIALLYAEGGARPLDESAPVDPTWITMSALDAEAQAARFAASGEGRRGIALRFANFYGPDSGHTLDAVRAARAGIAPEIGPPAAFRSLLTTDDAAAAVVAALTGAPSGVYNVGDDRPLPRSEVVDAIAAALGVGPLALPDIPPDVPADQAMILRSQRVSNHWFTAVTGWRPDHPSAWEGWPFVVAAIDERHGAART